MNSGLDCGTSILQKCQRECYLINVFSSLETMNGVVLTVFCFFRKVPAKIKEFTTVKKLTKGGDKVCLGTVEGTGGGQRGATPYPLQFQNT